MKKSVVYTVIAAFVVHACAPKVTKTPTMAPPPPIMQPTEKPISMPETSPVKETIVANALSAKEKAEGWQLLFDGTSTDGWHAYGSKTIGTAWKVANGTIFLDATKDGTPKTGGDIVSDKEYQNFELQLDWKISKAGNSGICIYANENKAQYDWMWSTGPEIQIVDNEAHPDGKIYKHQAGDLYDLVAAKSRVAHPPLEWNHYLIRCINGELDVYLNDVHVVSTTLWNDGWRTLIAASKFKSMPDFGLFKKGRIGLQDHGDNVWFRNIKIKEL